MLKYLIAVLSSSRSRNVVCLSNIIEEPKRDPGAAVAAGKAFSREIKLCYLGIILSLITLTSVTTAQALVVDTPLPNTADEARAQELFHHYRCVVCQSESVADSPADVASDVRAAIRDYVADGKSNADIEQLLVASYGEFILMKPAFSSANLWLWAMPLLLLIAGGFVLFRVFRKQQNR